MQPLHAAHQFTDTLSQQIAHPAQREAVRQVRGALDSTTDLLTGLFDMSRLEAGGLVPQPREFPLAEVLEPLAPGFRGLAAERGLQFDGRTPPASVRRQPLLLRRGAQHLPAPHATSTT